jgi:hypothetical protein
MKTQINAQIIKVTPELATEWLSDRWGEQRSIRQAHVSRLAADMEAGRFKVSPDAILRVKGKLANGQHRLEAILRSGKAQQFLVMESNDEELYKVIDAGLRRTVGDGLIGMPYAKLIPSIARWVKAYEAQAIFFSQRFGADAKTGRNKSAATQVEMIEYCISNHVLLSEAAGFVNKMYAETKLLPTSIGGAIYVIGENRNLGNKHQDFLEKVYIEGGTNAAGDLRNRLIADRGSKAKLGKGYIFAITMKALKSYCNGTRPGSS